MKQKEIRVLMVEPGSAKPILVKRFLDTKIGNLRQGNLRQKIADFTLGTPHNHPDMIHLLRTCCD